jgi:chemotaxis protein MotB
MTLMLTFFVVLVAMSIFDERSSLQVLDSISGTFGSKGASFNPFQDDLELEMKQPGPISAKSTNLENIRRTLFDDNEDVRLRQNALVMEISFNSAFMFSPGSAALTPSGSMMLDRLAPYLGDMKYPMLIAGHTGPRSEEEGAAYVMNTGRAYADSTWELSMDRSLAVYRHYLSRGIASSRMSMEAFGQYRPGFSNNTAEGRRNNRRVALILDKRNSGVAGAIESIGRKKQPDRNFFFRGFEFNLEYPDLPGRLEETRPENLPGNIRGGRP